jgi:hypothetical protein
MDNIYHTVSFKNKNWKYSLYRFLKKHFESDMSYQEFKESM